MRIQPTEQGNRTKQQDSNNRSNNPCNWILLSLSGATGWDTSFLSRLGTWGQIHGCVLMIALKKGHTKKCKDVLKNALKRNSSVFSSSFY